MSEDPGGARFELRVFVDAPTAPPVRFEGADLVAGDDASLGTEDIEDGVGQHGPLLR